MGNSNPRLHSLLPPHNRQPTCPKPSSKKNTSWFQQHPPGSKRLQRSTFFFHHYGDFPPRMGNICSSDLHHAFCRISWSILILWFLHRGYPQRRFILRTIRSRMGSRSHRSTQHPHYLRRSLRRSMSSPLAPSQQFHRHGHRLRHHLRIRQWQ